MNDTPASEVSKLSDEELMQEIVDQIRASRVSGHDRVRTRMLSDEAGKRGLFNHSLDRKTPTPKAPMKLGNG